MTARTHPGGMIVIAALLCAILTPTADAVPEYLNYQGLVNDSDGQPLVAGSYTLSISIYDSVASGTAVWGPFHFDGVIAQGHGAQINVVNGRFNIILGPSDVSGRKLSSAFAGNGSRFIQLTLEGDTITPRQQFLSVPYAFEAASTESAEVAALVARIRALEEQLFGTKPAAAKPARKPESRETGLE